MLVGAATALAYTNVLDNGAYQSVTNVWSIPGEDLVVGSSTSSNLMEIVDGGHVTSARGILGRDSSAWVNYVYVEGSDASWTMAGDLFVGDSGSSNYLEISSGGVVSNANAHVGGGGSTAYNEVAVSGSGSEWHNAGILSIGSGTSNLVGVTSGGLVVAEGLQVGSGSGGFSLYSGGTFRVGDLDAGMDGFNWFGTGSLVITNELTGMVVSNNFNYLDGGKSLTLDGGTWATDTNQLVVGPGSAANLSTTNGGWVLVGEAQTNGAAGGIIVASTNGAELVVDNGSLVESDTLILGQGDATGMASVTNGGVVKIGELEIEDGSAFSIDRDGTLFMADGFDFDPQTNLNWSAGGQLTVGGTLTKSNGLEGTERTLTLQGGDWTLGGQSVVSGTNNQFNVAEGSAFASTNGTVSGLGNAVLVQGAGALWSNEGALTVGGSNNSVTVQSGGRVETEGLDIQDDNDFNLSSGGTLAMTGDFDVSVHSNLNWNSGGNLSVAGDLTGMTSVSNTTVGYTTYLNGGRDLTLDGGQWTNGTDHLIVGYGSSNSDLAITNGAVVENANGYIGWGSASSANSVLVAGGGSAWKNNGGTLKIGANSSSDSSLVVSNNAWVFVGEASTNAPGGGMLVASTNGASFIVADGSATVEETLYLGLDTNTTGTATIQSGGTLSVGALEMADGSFLDLLKGGTFAIGADFNLGDYTTNEFVWGEGAALSVGGTLTGLATTNLAMGGATNLYTYLGGSRDLILDSGTGYLDAGNLVVGLGADGSALTVQDGAVLDSTDTVIGWGADDGMVVVTDGGSWNNIGDVTIGYLGDDNTLAVLAGGTATIGNNLHIGGDGTSGNMASANGSNAVLDVLGDVFVGNTSEVGGNALLVDDLGTVRVGGDLTLYTSNNIELYNEGTIELMNNMVVHSNSFILGSGTNLFLGNNTTLSFNGTGIDVDGAVIFKAEGTGNKVAVNEGAFGISDTVSDQYLGFDALTLTNSELYGNGSLDASSFDTVGMSGGVINPSGEEEYFSLSFGTLEIGGDVQFDDTEYYAEIAIVQEDVRHDQLVLSGSNSVDLSGIDLEVYVPNSLPDTNIVILAADGGFGGSEFGSTNIVDRMLLFDAALVLDDAGTASIRTEANGTKFSSALDFAGSEGIRAGYGAMKNAVFARTKQLRRNLVSTAHSLPHEVYLMTQTNAAPTGAEGPGDQNTVFDMHVWMQYFNGQGVYDAQGNSYGFDLNNGGTVIGADRLFGDDLTVGFNYTYARSDAQTTNLDSVNTETYWLGAYGEWVGENGLYVDSLAAMGFSNYDSIRREDNYEGTASYKGNNIGAYADVGQYYYYKNLALSPYVGLHFLRVVAKEHTETEAESSELTVHESERNWLESAVGLKGRYRFDTRYGRFQTTGYAEWTHDFLNEDVYSTLSADRLPPVDMARISPDSDMFNAGVGVSWICTDYMEIGVGYNGRYSGLYKEHTGSLMLDIMF